ncbi:MAG: adenosylcobinamide kinase/adenosylcobinamide phosphate guanyltransferase [Rhodomicrobium sp.]|nr:MAG: adenosylcobinamide kinase/adenosylcobinamide phosphate guanyltransferase [Rhodomicrobium sp.]
MPLLSNTTPRGKIDLILGGARSGKSRFAETEAEAYPEKIYIATAERDKSGLDHEMTARIKAHQDRRGENWQSIEEPIEIYSIIDNKSRCGNVILIDCLTLWLSNLMHHQKDLDLHTSRLIESLGKAEGAIIMVTNEVGLSIVPENALARRFRDEQGRLNQILAKAAHNVVFIAAGLPLCLKGSTS